jgi:hypothetical protein
MSFFETNCANSCPERIVSSSERCCRCSVERPLALSVLRKQLIAEEIYLGDDRSQKEMAWVANGSRRFLVSKTEATGATDLANGRILVDAVDRGSVEAALLTVIVHIPPEGCKLNPTAHWKAGTGVKFSDMKLECYGVAPDDPVLKADFTSAVRTLHRIFESTGMEDLQEGVLHSEKRLLKLRFRHLIFKVF